MISISIACALIIYLFGYPDSADGRGIASAAKLMCRKLASSKRSEITGHDYHELKMQCHRRLELFAVVRGF